ncbi:hypothetical protein BdWA1_002575 [Babesia duncani]|uniref:Uncharacterized protein n=1 Tax=Babesia duncani TaxID=323732 RepID=A0AAD9PK95_9APIC|nr:hypothetical protein BdWA1_002575 [Babesia duncani]
MGTTIILLYTGDLETPDTIRYKRAFSIDENYQLFVQESDVNNVSDTVQLLITALVANGKSETEALLKNSQFKKIIELLVSAIRTKPNVDELKKKYNEALADPEGQKLLEFFINKAKGSEKAMGFFNKIGVDIDMLFTQ